MDQCLHYAHGVRECLSQARQARQYPESARAVLHACRKNGIRLEAAWHPLGFGIVTRISNLERADRELREIVQSKPALLGTTLLMHTGDAQESGTQERLF